MLATWVQDLSPDVKDRLASFGLLDAHTRPLEEHLDESQAAQAAEGWGGDRYFLLSGPEGERLLVVLIAVRLIPPTSASNWLRIAVTCCGCACGTSAN